MSNTLYYQPESLAEAAQILPQMTSESAILAGGTDLLVQIRENHTENDIILSLCRIQELDSIEETDGWLRLGSMVTHDRAEHDEKIRKSFTALASACSRVGSQQVRNKGTIGGGLMNASVASDVIPPLLLFGAELSFLGPEGEQRIPIAEYLKNKSVWRAPGMLLTAIWLPVTDRLSAFAKLGSREEVSIAQLSLCASWESGETGKRHVRLVLGSVSPMPPYYDDFPLLEGETITPERADQAAKILSEKIREIRLSRTKPSKMKITPAEQQYKERAIRGVMADLADIMNEM